MADFTIKQIFQDNWDDFVLNNTNVNIRPIVFEEANKIINCGNPDFGYALYIYNHCGKFLKVPFRCKSRFFNTCGGKFIFFDLKIPKDKVLQEDLSHCIMTSKAYYE